jgi:glycosyl hydrolase family 2
MNHEQVKNSFWGVFVVCISFLLISCGSGSTGGGTTSIALEAEVDSIPADGARSMAITVTLTNSIGEAVAKGTSVAFRTTLGTFPNGSNTYNISTQDESGVVIISLISSVVPGSALVSVESKGVSQSMTVEFTDATVNPNPGTGEPVAIENIQADPETIKVKGTGGDEVSIITAQVVDENGQAYNDTQNNIRFEILAGPGGGELLDSGDGSPDTSKTTTTVGGVGTITLRSGTISGTLGIQVVVLKDASGTLLSTPISAVSTILGIESGEPHNISIYTSPTVQDNKDGSISWTISAIVQDQYGNPVADNTAVYFGIVDNIFSSGFNGETIETNQFFSLGTNFITNQVIQGDTLVLLEGQNEGGHIIDVPGNGSLTLANDLTGAESNLNFVAGNAEYGSICGVVLTGNLEPNETCSPTSGKTIKGVAHTRLTYGEPAIWKGFYIYAESEGGNTGSTLTDTYPAILPVSIDVSLSAAKVSPGTQVFVSAHLYDAGDHDIRDIVLTFTSSDPDVAQFVSTPQGTSSSGRTTATLNTVDTSEGTVTVEISVSAGEFVGSASLSVETSEP